jgi:hypothetical protein
MDQGGNAPSGGLIRSMIDALRRTPGFRDESIMDPEVLSDPESGEDSENQMRSESSGTLGEADEDQLRAEIRETRQTRETDLGRQPISGERTNSRRLSTDPKIQTPSLALMSAKLDGPGYGQELPQSGLSTDPRDFPQGFASTSPPPFPFLHSPDLGLVG